MKNSNFISFEQVDLKNGFWHDRYELNRKVSLENVRRRFEDSGRFDALRFNFLKNGRRPHIFFDSDVAKWMEAVAYLMCKDREAMRGHEALCEELIDCMERAQRPDGYLNSAHQQLTPETIFQNRNDHELYCAGHLIEAAIAYDHATGRDRFLKIMERYCDCIYRAFISEKTAAFTTPGHEEIELALMKLYRYTGRERCLEMARFFLEQRGRDAAEQYVYEGNRFGTQDDTDIYHLRKANGHSVRALYLYCGVADLAGECGDETLLENLRSVFADITGRKMYLTGGVGSTCRTESFTVGYDLPNHTAYSESCCAVAMILFACRMRRLDASARYGHMAERVLYNAMLSSTSLNGKAFFYENPLEIALEEYGREVSVPLKKREHLPITQRLEVFGCSCCPPNINRFFAELGDILCLEEDGHLCVEQYIPADIRTAYGVLHMDGNYATEGKVTLSCEDYRADRIAVRVPEWCRGFTATLDGAEIVPAEVRDGYAYFGVGERFVLALDFHIAPVFVAANPLVRADVGRIALTMGPVVYCLEGVDNGAHLNQITVDPADLSGVQVLPDPLTGLRRIRLPACRDKADDRLYFAADEQKKMSVKAEFIPYFAFANRGESDMLVWVRRR